MVADRPVAELLREAVAALELFARLELYSASSPLEECALIITRISKRDVDVARALLPRLSAALATGAAVPPEGWVTVPSEPTEEMIRKALSSTSHWRDIPGSALTVNMEKMRIRWRAMLAARPAAPPVAAEQPGSAKPARCEICGWPLEDSIEKGCVPGNCSYRPDPGSEEYARIQRNRERLKTEPVAPAEADADLVERVAQLLAAKLYRGGAGVWDTLLSSEKDAFRDAACAILPPIRDAARAEEREECAKFLEESARFHSNPTIIHFYKHNAEELRDRGAARGGV